MVDITDMSEFGGSKFLKFTDVVISPFRGVIMDVRKGSFNRPIIAFEGGTLVSANTTSVRALVRAYGKDPHKYVGLTVEAYAGQTEYDGSKRDSVLIRPISAPPSSSGSKFDDDVSF